MLPQEYRDHSLVSKEPYIHHDEPAIFFDKSYEQFLAQA